MKVITVLIAIFFTSHLYPEAAITYTFSGGRFGDNLLAYLHAKWLSYEYHVPLLYKPFKYSSELILDEREARYEYLERFHRHIRLDKANPAPIKESSDLYICSYFPEASREKLFGKGYFVFPVDWKNAGFRRIIRECLAPKRSLQLTYPPENVVSIALHLRDGEDIDGADFIFKDPLKVCPISFYAQCLMRVATIFQGALLYCYIFTDAPNPEKKITQLQQMLAGDVAITFNYRKAGNHHNSNVLEDFFSLFNFDILIRSESNFSIVPSLIHDYAVVCYPGTHYTIKGQEVTIDEIKVDIDQEICTRCLQRAQMVTQ